MRAELRHSADDHVATLRRQVQELCTSWRDAGRYVPRTDCWVRGFDQEFSRELGRQGLLGISFPRAYGGGALDNRARLAVTEELLRAGAPVAAHWVGDRQIGPAVLRHGTDSLKKALLPLIARGEAVCALGMSEPGAGSDLSSLRTAARRVEGGYVISGQKTWTSFAHRATHLYVLARTERTERKHQGLTEFVLDMDSPGIRTSPIVDMGGEHHFNDVFLDDVFVPEDHVLGRPGDGWRQVVEQLSLERGGPERVLSTYPLLVATVARAAGHGLEEEIGLLTTQLAILRQLCWQIADRLDAGEAPVREAATMKYLGNTFENDVIGLARRAGLHHTVDTHEAYQQTLLASPGFTIRGGSADVLLGIIAKAEVRS